MNVPTHLSVKQAMRIERGAQEDSRGRIVVFVMPEDFAPDEDAVMIGNRRYLRGGRISWLCDDCGDAGCIGVVEGIAWKRAPARGGGRR